MTGGTPHEEDWGTSTARTGAVDRSPGMEDFRDEQEEEEERERKQRRGDEEAFAPIFGVKDADAGEEQPAVSNVPSPGDDAGDAGTGDGLWVDVGNFPGDDESYDGDEGGAEGPEAGDGVSVAQFEFPGDDEADIDGNDDDESQGERDGGDRDEGAAGADAQGRFAGDGEEVASGDQRAAPGYDSDIAAAWDGQFDGQSEGDYGDSG
jgi:hypothetical protein